MRVLIGRNPVFYQRIKHRESVFYCFSLRYLYTIKQMKKPKLCITLLSGNSPDFWEHSRNEKKHSPTARVFYIFLKFSNARLVLSQCNARLRLLYLLNKDIGNDSDGSPFWSFTDLAQKQLILKEFSRWKNFLESPQNSCLAKFSHAESVVLIYYILQLNPYFFITPAITPFFLAEKSFPFLSFLQYIQKF